MNKNNEKTYDYESYDDQQETKLYNAKIENIEIALLNRYPEYVDQIYFFSQEYRSNLQQLKQKWLK